jgi:hypothetical protein
MCDAVKTYIRRHESVAPPNANGNVYVSPLAFASLKMAGHEPKHVRDTVI